MVNERINAKRSSFRHSIYLLIAKDLSEKDFLARKLEQIGAEAFKIGFDFAQIRTAWEIM